MLRFPQGFVVLLLALVGCQSEQLRPSGVAQGGVKMQRVESRVVAPRLFIRIVADAEKTGAFYERLGFEMGGMPLDANGHRPYMDNPAIARMYDAPGLARFLTAKPLGEGPSMLLLEFKSMPKEPLNPNWADIGSTMTMVTVHDLDPVLTVLAREQIKLLASNGQASRLADGNRVIVVRDPDGALLEIREQRQTAAVSGNLISLGFAIAVASAADSAAFYQRILGADVTAVETVDEPARLAAGGVKGRRYQRSVVSIPGSPLRIELLQVAGERRRLQITPHSVGAGILRMVVKDFNEMLSVVRDNHLPILSAGGEPLMMGTSDIFITPDPNGFILEPSKPRS